MTQIQSKLMLQLAKQQRISHRFSFNQQQIEDLFSTICKFQSKNLMLIEFLGLVIEKDLIKNSNKISYFVDLYQQIKGKNLQQDNTNAKNDGQIQEQKFNKKKFIRLLKEMAKKIYPSNANPYETVLFQKITKFEIEEHRIKFDDNVKKLMTKQIISALSELDKQLQNVFQMYMPQNYNFHHDFTWQELRILQKKLPIICFFRFLYEAQILPQFITPTQFLQIIIKLKPPSIPSTSSSKQVLFYTNETLSNYFKDYIGLNQIKILQGDLGLNFFQFQVLFLRVAAQFIKDTKGGDILSNIKKIVAHIKLKQAFDENSIVKNKFMQNSKNFIKNKNKCQKIIVKKKQVKKKIQQLFDTRDIQLQLQSTKNVYLNLTISDKQIENIKKQLQVQLPEIPLKKKIDKQNDPTYDIQKKHIVIGQQLPKIQQKAKTSGPKDPKKKNEDVLLGYKPQVQKQVQQSDSKLVRRPKKIRINNEFPIILNQVYYPSALKQYNVVNSKAQVYLQTSYIHIGQRLYQDSYYNYNKALHLSDTKNPAIDFFYKIHAAQIFESAGRDSIALSFYHKAKQASQLVLNLDIESKAYPYLGLGACFFHLQQYEFALRCFEKARLIFGVSLDIQSMNNAILQNNIGCCLMMINRNQEAIRYFQISHNIFDLKLGKFDQRTLVVQQNLNKNKKAYLQLLPQFKTMWKTYLQKNSTKLPSVKTAGKGKK